MRTGKSKTLLARTGAVVLGALAFLLAFWLGFAYLGPSLEDHAEYPRPRDIPPETFGVDASQGDSSEVKDSSEVLEVGETESLEEFRVEVPEPPAVARLNFPEEGVLDAGDEAVDEAGVGVETGERGKEATHEIVEQQEIRKPRTPRPQDPRPVLIRIPRGTFEMGDGESPYSDERPVHTVRLASFYLSKTEVTVAQYRACVEAGGCAEPVRERPLCTWMAEGKDDHPINCVSWHDAKAYAEWIDARLPSEAEWEYAARSGGLDREYPWGTTEATCDLAVIAGCGSGTQPVCSQVAGNTEQGLCDMGGNVFEWLEDDRHMNYWGAPGDGRAWIDSPRAGNRVIRGGSWGLDPKGSRVALRLRDSPVNRSVYVGFRIARSFPFSQ